MLQRVRCRSAHAALRHAKTWRFVMCGCDKRAVAAQSVNEAALAPQHLQHNAARSIVSKVLAKVMCV